jgi:sigma-B regulation protein RsbU (phosphoserine phosphatase)
LRVVGLLYICIVPFNIRSWFSIKRALDRELAGQGDEQPPRNDPGNLNRLAGRIINLPTVLAGTNLVGWVAGALIFGLLPHVWPEHYPWHPQASHRMFVAMVSVGVFTAAMVYFIMEWWLRNTVRDLFPAAVLQSVPPSFRIRVLPKLLSITLFIGTVPVVLIGHIALQGIREIQHDPTFLEAFLSEMPLALQYVVAWAVCLAVPLSIFLARSISEPLEETLNAMKRIGTGNLDTRVRVFSNDEIGTLGEGLNRMVGGLRQRDAIKAAFGRYVPPEIVEEITDEHKEIDLAGEVRDMTILVADLRGFTPLAESLAPARTLKLLNRYFETMTDVIFRHQGTIDELTGDGILVFFGAPRRLENHARQAVQCALDMHAAMDELNAGNRTNDLPPLEMGIAINSGELIVGNIGSWRRMKYGAVGTPINVAFRVEGHAGPGEILVTPSVYGRLGDDLSVRSTKQVTLKGLAGEVTLYGVDRLDHH